MYRSPLHFSPSTRIILDGALHPGKAPKGIRCYPPDLTNAGARASGAQTPLEWIKVIAQRTQSPEQLAIFDNIAFHAELRWDRLSKRDLIITEVHCQAVVLVGQTVSAVLEDDSDIACHSSAQYMRLDYEPRNLGSLFAEPIPHIHSNLKGEPRFSFPRYDTAPHVDFLEFLIRNYVTGVWNAWVDSVWEQRVSPKLKIAGAGVREDPGPIIRAAFMENRLLDTTGLANWLSQWKAALIAEKRTMSHNMFLDENVRALDY